MSPVNIQKKQARGIKSAKKVIAAAESLFATQGMAATTIAQIVEKSGVSIGSFYHHFGSKEAVFETLIREFCKGGRDSAQAMKFHPTDLHACVATFVQTLTNLFQRNPMLYKTMARRAGIEPGIWKPMRELRAFGEEIALEGFGHLLEEKDTARRKIQQITQVILATLTHSVLFDSGPIHYKADDCSEQLTAMAMGILAAEIK